MLIIDEAADITVEEFMRMAKWHTDKVCASKEQARQELIDLGIYNADGSLHKNYGGT